MTTIYIVMVEDRHYDTEAHLFSTQEKAISYAKALIEAEDRYGEDDEPMTAAELKAAGWLWQGKAGEDGTSAWVLPAEVDSEVE